MLVHHVHNVINVVFISLETELFAVTWCDWGKLRLGGHITSESKSIGALSVTHDMRYQSLTLLGDPRALGY